MCQPYRRYNKLKTKLQILGILFTSTISPYSHSAEIVVQKGYNKIKRNEHKHCKKCVALIKKIEIEMGIPKDLLHSIAYVESRLRPYAVHVKRQSHYFDNKSEAVAFVNLMKKQGYKNIDVGCMQVNLMAHGKQFVSIEQALDPETNILYAARLIKAFKKRFGDWGKAVKYYHTSNPKYHNDYHARVYKVYGNAQAVLHMNRPDRAA
ncbi:MAG: hypothetical protein COY39_03015 [Alphaproteobacteria bacterium CG_4_10_14_0_8_um_filter_37_21]|nr:MAG: hypothetical protein COY39_03015 [Alphaproteobacteria bacterium CG_4_10_14_0_8_um_filter_37_21]